MKENMGKCPGCRKGCSADAPRCKYGKKYFAKLSSAQEPCAEKKREAHEKLFRRGKKRKWEKNVEREGMLWHFLMVGRGIKKMLLAGKIREEEIWDALSSSEKEALESILEKMAKKIYCR